MKIFKEIVIPILIAVLVFIAVQAMIESREVFNISMLPSIKPGERIIVGKISYAFKEPKRGDIIVFESSRRESADLIKRIIGLPGDTIEIKNGMVFINGNPINESYINEPPGYKFPQFVVPEGEYFVLGDNRNNSSDSHLGWTLPRDNIIGKVLFTYWPPQEWHAAKHYSLGVN